MNLAVAASAPHCPPPTGLGGEKNRRRFFDAASAAWMVKVMPGDFYITRDPAELIVTVLGSCVAACMRDPLMRMGGINHFMLAGQGQGAWGDEQQSMRYGTFAMERLLNELLKAGCARERLEIKLFGGGNVIDAQNQIGTQNGDFALRYIETEGLTCVASDLYGSLPRRITYSPATGKVVRRLLNPVDRETVAREENSYVQTTSAQQGGSVEIFKKWRR